MDILKLQIILFWASVVFFAAGTVFYVASILFKHERFINYGTFFAWLGFIPNTAAIFARWYQTGHFPYWNPYEVFTSYAWGIVLVFLVFQHFKPSLKIVGAFVLPVAFLLTGMGVMGNPEVKDIPRTFFTFWLYVHIGFAKISAASVIISAGLAVLYLVKRRQQLEGRVNPTLERLPDVEKLDFFSYRVTAFAFIMIGIMIASGAVWAYKAWGRYWGWDPIETWALISWLVYGLYLHLRITMGWKGNWTAWLSVIALVLVIFSFWGIPLVYDSVHEHLKYKITK
ncbi:MAG: c-type cytochrome biogenesis protein CcsB [Bacillota bacterium]